MPTTNKRKAAQKKAPQPDFLDEMKSHVRSERLYLEALGREIVVMGMSAADMRTATMACLKPGKSITDGDAIDDERLTTHIIAASIRDDDGNRLVPAGREDEIIGLPQDAYIKIQTAALRCNGMAQKEEDSA